MPVNNVHTYLIIASIVTTQPVNTVHLSIIMRPAAVNTSAHPIHAQVLIPANALPPISRSRARRKATNKREPKRVLVSQPHRAPEVDGVEL